MGHPERAINHPTHLSGSRAVFVYALIGALSTGAMLSIGGGGSLAERILAAVLVGSKSAWIPMVYLLGSLGLGRIVRRWTSGLPLRWVIELGVGLTLALTLSHGLGALGILNTTSAWIVTGGGCLLVGLDLRPNARHLNHSIGHTSLSIPGIAFVIGCVLVVLMALNPPGTLWDSEYGGYDALSYHLELPREWLENGRIWPSNHNVYSYLPSYFESAYVHFANLANAPKATPSGLAGLLANDAQVTMSIQLFSALLVIVSAIAMRSVVRRAIELFLDGADLDDRTPALCARMLMVCTPWIVVVGSLAYNEMGVVLLAICTLAIVIERERSDLVRSGLSALIVGGACSVKPTALFLVAPSIGVILLATIPPRRWIKPVALGLFVGALTLAPWLIRNEIASGNPVFPQMASVFGDGGWSTQQLSIYASAHHFDGSLLDRITLLVMPDPDGIDHVSRFRGLSNLQWGITPWIGLLGCMVLLIRRRTRRLGGAVTAAIILPTLGWLLLTHLQSRFLVPITPMMIGAGALGVASIEPAAIRRMLVSLVSTVALGWVVMLAASQSNGNPFMLIDLGAGVFTGEIEIGDAPWTAKLNEILEPNETVYLLGDATPVYVRSPMVYNTVYDRWIIEDAIEQAPDDPSQWTAAIKNKGIDVVVVSFSEINRFAESGWLPESINPDQFIEWINTLGEPIYVWTLPTSNQPIRACFRLDVQ